jgi:predicted phage-related endonuclease
VIPDRTKFIGGSDAAAVLGVSPWATPLTVYLEKTGQSVFIANNADPERERRLRRGRLMEPVVIDMLCEETQVKVTKRSQPLAPNYHIDRALPYLAAQLDFEWEVRERDAEQYQLPESLIGTVQNGEVKTAHPYVAMRKFGEQNTDEIPIEYGAQDHHGQMVNGAQVTLVALLVGSDDLRTYIVRRDEALIRAMREAEVRFWTEHVLKRAPPDPKTLADVQTLLSKSAETRREATPDMLALVSTLELMREREREIGVAVEALKYQLGAFLLGAEAVDAKKPGVHYLLERGEPVYQVALQHQERIDLELLRKKHPKVAAECAENTSFFKFSKPRKGTR